MNISQRNLEEKRSCVAIGAGPSNLSLSCLNETHQSVDLVTLEKQSEFSWHSGMQLQDSELQVSFLKDLVTLVDPCSRYSFLNYLKDHRRMYRALVANREYTSRLEFQKYLQWVTSSLPSVQLGTAVENVRLDGARFVVETAKREYHAHDLVIGTGRRPKIPHDMKPSSHWAHTSQYMERVASRDLSGCKITVIGGGQSGAEIVLDLLSKYGLNIEVTWISRRHNLHMLEDSPFINEMYFPNYFNYLQSVGDENRKMLNNTFKMTSDGISERTLSALYRKLYDLNCLESSKRNVDIKVGCSVEQVEERGKGFNISYQNQLSGTRDEITSDEIIFATGYKFELPQFLHELVGKGAVIQPDFTLDWQFKMSNRIFVQNSCVDTFGLAEPNLALLPWRSARILNQISGQKLFDLNEEQGAIQFNFEHQPIPAVSATI